MTTADPPTYNPVESEAERKDTPIRRKPKHTDGSFPDGDGTPRAERRSFAEAAESPCTDCPDAPCCSYLPLRLIRMETFTEVDHARFLLNFDRIELGVSRTGEWRAFYRAPCRHLDTAEGACRLHGSPAQSRVCRHYNPFSCWYREILVRGSDRGFLRVDRRRLEALLPLLAFDGDGRLRDVPDWPTLAASFRQLPAAEWPATAGDPPADPQDRAWRDQARGESGPLPQEPPLAWGGLADPCADCGALCCRVLTFPGPVPSTATGLDHFRFQLGFPGVSLGVADTGWHLVVRSACRHLADGRCAVFGQPGRPKECDYIDAWNCASRLRFGTPRPPGFLRVSPALFPWLLDQLRFNRDGRVIAVPPVRELQARLEDRWRRERRDPETDPLAARQERPGGR